MTVSTNRVDPIYRTWFSCNMFEARSFWKWRSRQKCPHLCQFWTIKLSKNAAPGFGRHRKLHQSSSAKYCSRGPSHSSCNRNCYPWHLRLRRAHSDPQQDFHPYNLSYRCMDSKRCSYWPNGNSWNILFSSFHLSKLHIHYMPKSPHVLRQTLDGNLIFSRFIRFEITYFPAIYGSHLLPWTLAKQIWLLFVRLPTFLL